ncbi:MAG: RNA-binding protein [Pseudomonadota bacterium]
MGTRLYVGNIPYGTTDADLRALFGQNGRRVTDVKIISDRETGQSRGFAFVEMASGEEAQAAIGELSGSAMGGRSIVVNEARDRVPGGRFGGGATTGGAGSRGGAGGAGGRGDGGNRSGGERGRGGPGSGGERSYGGQAGQGPGRPGHPGHPGNGGYGFAAGGRPMVRTEKDGGARRRNRDRDRDRERERLRDEDDEY